MRRALALAQRGEGRVEPNPMVGCVLARGGRIIAEGWHRRFGGAHAEVNALRAAAGASLSGATAYVTLEPCCITGKTPPCVDALIAARVRRVVAATLDPNPRVDGGGVRALRRAGVRVEIGLLRADAEDLIAPFRKLMLRRRPWVIAKWAQSLDGVIATHAGDARWISDLAARAHAHRVRGRVDAILVGVNTVLRDDPRLTCRHAAPRRVAARIVLDSSLRTPLSAALVRTARRQRTMIFCTHAAPARRAQRLESAGCIVHATRADRGRVRIDDVLDTLGRAAMSKVLVEGGGETLGAFFDRRLIDEIHAYVAPSIVGGRAATHAVAGEGAKRVADALRLLTPRMRRLGGGWFLRARVGISSR